MIRASVAGRAPAQLRNLLPPHAQGRAELNAHAHNLSREQVVKLMEENEHLRETVRQYEVLLKPKRVTPWQWGLTAREADLLFAIRSASPNVMSRERALIAIYGMIWDDMPDQKILDVWLSKLRRKLQSSGSGLVIETVWGRGWLMSAETASQMDLAINAMPSAGSDCLARDPAGAAR